MACPILGNPKPKASPCYPDFKPLQHQQLQKRSEMNDMGWLLIRYCSRTSANIRPMNRSDAETNEHTVHIVVEPEAAVADALVTTSKQSVPVWGAYNSIVASSLHKSRQVDMVHALPLINAPPQKWNTLVTSLMHLYRVNMLTREPDSKSLMCVWLDMDVYKRVLKLPYLLPDLYKDKWIESPGQFHITVCALRCLGRTVEGSGLEDMWVEADIYSNVTVMQIINGKHYNRAIECHLFTLEALSDLWFDQFFTEHPEMIQALQESVNTLTRSCQKQEAVAEAHTVLLARMIELDLPKLMEEFDTSHGKYPMYRWARMYMRQVSALLQFIRSTRLRLWDLHLSSLEQLCIWFFAYNRMDYALNIPEYIARMYSLQHTKSEVWKEFEEGGFTVDTSPVAFTAIGVDQAQEHVNKGHKGGGGICGITSNPEVLMRYCLSTTEPTRLSSETESMLGLKHSVRKQHHDMSEAKIVHREKYINQLKEVLSKANPLKAPESTDDTDLRLVHLTNKIIMPDNVQKNILNSENRGEPEYRIFVEEIISGDNIFGTAGQKCLC